MRSLFGAQGCRLVPPPPTARVNGSGLSETPERNRSAMEPAAYLENAGNILLVFGLYVSLYPEA